MVASLAGMRTGTRSTNLLVVTQGVSMQGKVVVITGASGGIGAAAARAVASRRGPLALVARREGELRAVAERCGTNALPVVADVTRRDDVRRSIRAAIEHF